jgi:hypothetical protein
MEESTKEGIVRSPGRLCDKKRKRKKEGFTNSKFDPFAQSFSHFLPRKCGTDKFDKCAY